MKLNKELFVVKLKEVLNEVAEDFKFESATIMFSNNNPQQDGTTYSELDISWNNRKQEFEVGTYKETNPTEE